DRRGFCLDPGEDLLDAIAERAVGQRPRVVVDFGGDVTRCSAPDLVLSEIDHPHRRPRQPRIAKGGKVGAGHCVLIHSIKCTPPTKSGRTVYRRGVTTLYYYSASFVDLSSRIAACHPDQPHSWQSHQTTGRRSRYLRPTYQSSRRS